MDANAEQPSGTGPAAATKPDNECQWEHWNCTRPREAKVRPDAPGPRPKFCGQADDPDASGPAGLVHNASTQWREYERQRRGAAASVPAIEEEDPAPVRRATKTAGDALDRAEKLHAALRETAEQIAESIRVAGDPRAAEAQIAAT